MNRRLDAIALLRRGGKICSGLHALQSGVAVILAAGILFTPVVHRLLHQFNLEDKEK